MKVIEKKYLLPFSIVSILFLLWGLANNLTDTLLAAFKHIMTMTDFETSLIPAAFYFAYFCFSLPSALFIRKYSYKAGVVVGLALYALGCVLFTPAGSTASYPFFLIAIYIMAGGCSMLETTANPYILSMGAQETATRRLNIAQALNPIGSISGVLVCQYFILAQLQSPSASSDAERQAKELAAVSDTYLVLAAVLIAILALMFLVKMPETNTKDNSSDKEDSVVASFRRLSKNKKYVYGVIAQFFYVGAQVGVWSFTIRLAMQELGINEKDGANIYLLGSLGFCFARFVFTWLMKYYRPALLMTIAASIDIACCLVVVCCGGMGWLPIIALVLISVFMSLQFPTIYGIALEGQTDDAKIGASGLIMAILGGAVISPVQGWVSDQWGINASYVVPLICFVVVTMYGVMDLRPLTPEVKR